MALVSCNGTIMHAVAAPPSKEWRSGESVWTHVNDKQGRRNTLDLIDT